MKLLPTKSKHLSAFKLAELLLLVFVLSGSVAACAWLLGMASAIVEARPPKSLKLVWDYPEPHPNITFNIYYREKVTDEFTFLTNVAEKEWIFRTELPMGFLGVTATNVVTGMESGFSLTSR